MLLNVSTWLTKALGRRKSLLDYISPSHQEFRAVRSRQGLNRKDENYKGTLPSSFNSKIIPIHPKYLHHRLLLSSNPLRPPTTTSTPPTMATTTATCYCGSVQLAFPIDGENLVDVVRPSPSLP